LCASDRQGLWLEFNKLVSKIIHAKEGIEMTEEFMPEKIRNNLKKYEKHINKICLECGYSGLMGIVSETKSSTGFWIALGVGGFILGIFAGGYGLFLCLIIGVWVGVSSKKTLECPSCNSILQER